MRKRVAEQFTSSGWTTIFESTRSPDGQDSLGLHCAIVTPAALRHALEDNSWDVRIGEGGPTIVSSYANRVRRTRYQRAANPGFIYLVHRRSGYGTEDPYCELSEEFRLYYDLYEETANRYDRKYYYIDDAGDKTAVAEIKKDLVAVQTRFLKDYISVRRCFLLLFFDAVRYSDTEELPADETVKSPLVHYRLVSSDTKRLLSSSYGKSLARMLGKCSIPPIAGYRLSEQGRFPIEKLHEDFVIGFDSDGRELTFTSDEDHLSNYFGKNPNAPNYLTPVYFSPEVLNKYYGDPSRYEVSDGLVSCTRYWSLEMDNNLSQHVAAFLGDLGHLPYKEQLHWKSYNIPPQAGMSHAAVARAFMGQFAEPEKADLFLKNRLNSFSEVWRKNLGWDLFLPLSEGDEHYLTTLHIPTSENNPKEFEEQVLAITKLTIDSLNEAKLAEKQLSLQEGAKSLDKLEGFLGIHRRRYPEMMEFLRNLQALRSTKVAHRKSRQDKRTAKLDTFFEIGVKSYREVFTDIATRMIWTLNTLDRVAVSLGSSAGTS